MVDLKILEAMGSTDARLKEIFTAAQPSVDEDARMNQAQRDSVQRTIKIRQKFEEDIRQRTQEAVYFNLRNWQMYSAVDVAWDAAPINKNTIPLMLYAQGKSDLSKCTEAVKKFPNPDQYFIKDTAGTVVGIDTPKFFEVNFNLMRSVISRRHAAQCNKYAALFPYFKYEARGTSQVAKLRADAVSQQMDIMKDDYDLEHHEMQIARDAMLYGYQLDFIRSKWEKTVQYRFDEDFNPDLPEDKENARFEAVVEKEGFGWVNPHPTRCFWDNSVPISLINSDTGPQFIGFWDVVRYGDVVLNSDYWNTKSVSFNSGFVNVLTNYANYFSQYYACTITPPCLPTANASAENDRVNNIGTYSQNMNSISMLLCNYYRRVVPKDHGIGDYPFPVWLRMVFCGIDTVVHAEFLPSTPACYLGINQSDNRQYNISIGMELLPYQDQLSQLLSLLLYTVQNCNTKVLCLNTDGASPESVKEFREKMKGKERYNMVHVWEFSQTKLQDAGVDPKHMVELVETSATQALPQIFEAIQRLIGLAERLLALSPQELGQPAPREITATETTLIAGTTETIYGFISDSIDECRAARKRIMYESWMACAEDEVIVPVVNRYPRSVIEKAGFTIQQEDPQEAGSDTDAQTGEGVIDSKPREYTIVGTKQALKYNYIFTSRDGAQRATNTQAANALVQLLGVLKDPMILQSLPKQKFYEIINEIFRLSGTGVDLLLETAPGDNDQMGPDRQSQIEQVLQQLTQNAGDERQEVAKLDQTVEQLLESIKVLTQQVQQLQQQVNSGPQVDPIEAAQAGQEMQMDQQSHQMDMAGKQQDLIQAAQSHAADMKIKNMKALQLEAAPA